MRKSIVLMTLAALTAGLAVGCASSGEMPARPLFGHFASDYTVRRQLETAVLTPPRAPAPAATVIQPSPQRARAKMALSRPSRFDR